MKITLCGSIKFFDDMRKIQSTLEQAGHFVHMPIKADGVDYWSEDNASRVEAKRNLELISEHMDKVEDADAILVVNMTKGDIENYIGANTFLEIGFAHHRKKKIYFLNSMPGQKYILDEIETVQPIILNGDLSLIN
ncbi:hypothetical protein ACFL3E_00880 [Patescibacteria group bacterium]